MLNVTAHLFPQTGNWARASIWDNLSACIATINSDDILI